MVYSILYRDSGFDQHLLSTWDNEISLDIMAHWANLIDDDGWVAREQILGDEARSKVPKEFQTQYPHFANPPTLITGLRKYLEHIEKASVISIGINFIYLGNDGQQTNEGLLEQKVAVAFMNSIYPKFKKQYMWFRETQWGEIADYTSKKDALGFRWRGKKGAHILTSGLDDYPRAPASHTSELHLDLICWVTYYAKTLKAVAHNLHLQEDVETYEGHEKLMLQTLEGIKFNNY